MNSLLLCRSLPLLALAATGLMAAADPDAERLPAGEGRDAVVKVCTTCHGVDKIRRRRFSEDQWSDKVGDMVDRGAQGTADEIAAINAYLVANFGPSSKVQVNTAPLPELKAVLGLTTDEAGAVIAYRTEHGAFHKWDDLLKVPGVDGKKIEAKKEAMAFL